VLVSVVGFVAITVPAGSIVSAGWVVLVVEVVCISSAAAITVSVSAWFVASI
jgi:hypothetical protein